MKIAIRQASLADEQERLIEILDKNLPGRPNREIQKRRQANPLGPGWSWVACRPDSDGILAMASVFPRSVRVDGKKVVCGQVVEFAVEAPYRSLGPAVLLQRATFEPTNSGAVAFCYDCPPHDRGMSTFVRLGLQPNCEVFRYALLLRSDEYLAKRLGNGAWTKPLVATANMLLQARRSHRSLPEVEICRHNGVFDEEFSSLDQATSSSGKVRASRAADDLNWRYLEDPKAKTQAAAANTGKYRVLVARRSGELIAFSVLFIQDDGIAWLADLFGKNLTEAGRALLEAAVDICRREKVKRLDAFCGADSAVRPLLEDAGFRIRERIVRVVAYENGCRSRKLHSGLSWAFGQFEVMW
jgi:hypothetical protein